jgi:NarL family two-component system sensor histidine kinase YdfH
MLLDHLLKRAERSFIPSPPLAACCSIVWTALWFLIGLIGISDNRQFAPYALLMLGVALLYGIRTMLAANPVLQVASLLVQVVLMVGVGFVLEDTIFPVALLFALLGETLYLNGLAFNFLVVLLGSFIGVIGLAVVSAGNKYLFAFAVAGVLLSPLPLLLGVSFAMVRQVRQQQAYQERLHTLMLEHQQAQILSHERQRMARDLHDTLAQGVAGIILQLEATKPYLASGDGERVHQIIDHTLQRARATLQEARAAIADLRVTASLRKRVHEKVDHFRHLTAIPCEVTAQDIVCDDPRVTEIALYTLGEGLTNIAQHAHASQVAVSITQSKRTLTLQIQDDGCGFDPRKSPGPGHYGLLGMRERILLIGGRFTLESAIGQGTCLQVHLPLEEVA